MNANPETQPELNRKSRGFSIIEVMVAGVILGIAISGVMSMLGSGRDLESSDGLRKQARILADSVMEDLKYHPTQYATLTTDDPGTSKVISLESEAGAPVSGTLLVRVSPEQNASWNDGNAPGSFTQSVPYRQVSAKITWTFVGRNDSAFLQRRVALAP